MSDFEFEIDEYEDKFDCDYKVESDSSEDYVEESDEEEYPSKTSNKETEMKEEKQMEIDFRSNDINVRPPVYGKKADNKEYF